MATHKDVKKTAQVGFHYALPASLKPCRIANGSPV